jgi:hypothetical protein
LNFVVLEEFSKVGANPPYTISKTVCCLTTKF